MQAATCFVQPFLPITSTKHSPAPMFAAAPTTSRCVAFKVATVAYDSSTVDYSSSFSVFPAEACETIGGDACAASMYPEAKLTPETRVDMARVARENVEREYFDYSDPKSVMRGEACDDLGGEFCEAPYKRAVYQIEKTLSKICRNLLEENVLQNWLYSHVIINGNRVKRVGL